MRSFLHVKTTVPIFSWLALAVLTAVVFLPVVSHARAIHRAVANDDLGEVAVIIERSLPGAVNSRIGSGVTPLHLAAAVNSPEMIAFLVSRGADIEATTDGGFTPLHWAAGRDASDAVMQLLSLGADANAQAMRSITPLHWAAGKNATNVVKLLMAAGADLQSLTEKGLSPLHWAMRNEDDTAASLLAYEVVSEEMATEEAAMTNAPPEPPPEPEPAAEPAVPEPVPIVAAPPPAIAPDRSLSVDIGLGERLVLVWIESLDLWMGKTEISNGQFRRFRPTHTSRFREGFSLDGNEQPVVYVNWQDAADYCAWLNRTFYDRIPAGTAFRIPTEAEWLLAASCGVRREYPWGNQWPPPYGNFSDMTARKNLAEWSGIRRYEDGFTVTCPVGESGASEWGIYGMAGNVWEWCQDWYDADQTYRVRKGGSWDFDTKPQLRLEARGFDRPEARYDTIGFRIVLAAAP